MSRQRTHLYRVCVTDTVIYAKVFEARSPRDALVQASVDTERNRDWRADWNIIGQAVKPDPEPQLVDPAPPVQVYRVTRREFITEYADIAASSPEAALAAAHDVSSDAFEQSDSYREYDQNVEEVRP